MTNPPPVAPVVTDKMLGMALDVYNKTNCAEGKTQDDAMRAAITAALEASGELERLRAALQKLYDGLAWDWRGHPVGDLPTLREIARTALEGSTL